MILRFTTILLLNLLISSSLYSQTKTACDTLKIQLTYGFNRELNTFEGVFKKDLAIQEFVSVPFSFSPIELCKIKALALDSIDFFSLPDSLPRASWVGPMSPDPGFQILRLRYGSKEHKILWDNRMSRYVEDQRIFMKLVRLIIDIVESHPEVKSLPREKMFRL